MIARRSSDRRAMGDGDAAALYRLMTWLSPAFPVGGFSYSSGIEWAVEAGDIANAATLARLARRDACAKGPASPTGSFSPMRTARRRRATMSRLREVAELAAAFVPSRERQLETSAQGRAFIEIARSAWSCAGLEQAIAAAGGAIVYPVAVGLVSAGARDSTCADAACLPACADLELDFGRRPAHSARADRLPAGSRRRWKPVVAATAQRALAATLDDIGSATLSRRSRQPAPRDAIYAGCSGRERTDDN